MIRRLDNPGKNQGWEICFSVMLLSYCFIQFGSESESVEGSYSFTSPEGQEVSVSYTADENGYFPRVRKEQGCWQVFCYVLIV